MAKTSINADHLTTDHIGKYTELHNRFRFGVGTAVGKVMGLIVKVEHSWDPQRAVDTHITLDIGVTTIRCQVTGLELDIAGSPDELTSE